MRLLHSLAVAILIVGRNLEIYYMPKNSKKIQPLIDEITSIAGKPAREEFAKQCGTSLNMLQQVGYGNRSCSLNLAIGIDKATGGRLQFQKLYPDVDWPFVAQRLNGESSGATA